ncbi:hypothetical protein GGD67_003823 [Bradyrhizobium sp. IAR9]|uniref:hypothetical protein n=1 Tax=Bradyrhizobium sp. IAR9 TaxID=2663841 RepID=UPI0015C8B3FE|nr:hypothetical protein [Bradyrhizobium sp. IAR9]NYG46352.1 hypothetical protein [Bradyrhizobium sp. IAR9]
MPNDITTRGYPLPHPDNVAREDAQRIRDALAAISEDLDSMGVEPATETELGGVRLATDAEATGGTATDAVPVVKRVKDMITSVTTALHTTIVGEYGAAITTAINNLKAGVDPAYDTLVEIAAKLTDMTQINAILDSLAKRLRVDTAAQGLDATSQANGRANLGLGNIAIANGVVLADLRSGTGQGVVTTDKAWQAAGFVDLGNSGSGTLQIDCNIGSRFRVVLTGNVAVSFINAKDGQNVDVAFVQDATGGRTLSWNSNIRFPNGTAPTVATAANGWALVFTGVYNSLYAQWLGAGWKVT